MISLSHYRQLRSRGVGYDAAKYPNGVPGVQIDAAPGREWCECAVRQSDAGVAERGVMRAEVAGHSLPRFGRWQMQAEFCVPDLWAQQSLVMWASAIPDAGDAGIHNAPFSLVLQGDVLTAYKRSDAAASSVASVDAVKLGSARIVRGRWHRVALDMQMSWLADGAIHATLDGAQRLAADVGPNCYNDQSPPYFGFGVYWWEPTGDPMRMLVRRFEVI